MKKANAIISGRELYCLPIGTKVIDVLKYMAEKNIGAVALVDNISNRKLRGIFSERDLLKRVVLPGLDPKQATIDDVMTKNVAVGQGGESYEICLETMKRINSRHLPIVDGDKFIGMISIRDLMEVNLEDKDEEIRMMNAYIHDVPAL